MVVWWFLVVVVVRGGCGGCDCDRTNTGAFGCFYLLGCGQLGLYYFLLECVACKFWLEGHEALVDTSRLRLVDPDKNPARYQRPSGIMFIMHNCFNLLDNRMALRKDDTHERRKDVCRNRQNVE